jgi:hypothetical protein
MNGPKNNDKKMKWPVEAIGILVLQDVLGIVQGFVQKWAIWGKLIEE